MFSAHYERESWFTEVLEWRVDQTQSSGTTKRQLEALESLVHMQVDSIAERRTRCVILGMPHSAKLAKEKNSWAGCALSDIYFI